MNFLIETHNLNMFYHIAQYIKIIKFDLFNYQMFLWLSGIVQGLTIKGVGLSQLFRTLFFFFFSDWTL